MPLPTDLNAYADVKTVLDAALVHNGGSYKFQTRNEAMRWRARAYQFRRLLVQHPYMENPYTRLILTIGKSDTDTTVLITIAQPTGEFTTPDGKTVDLGPGEDIENPVGDELLDDAKNLLKELGE